jgi:Zn-dependent oligopeptidase
MTNPLLTPFSLPPFSAIKPEHVVPAVTKALDDCRAAVERAVAQGAPYTWENLCQPLAEVDDVLGRLFSGQPPELGQKQSGAARSLRADPAAAFGVQHLGWAA